MQPGRVTIWADQSGRGDDAVLQHAQLGPQCLGASSPHAANGVSLPYFSRPMSATTPNVVDETLDVDLQFLVKSNYTIFAIERRWADVAGKGETIVGTTLPIPYQHPNYCSNSSVPANSLISFGYTFYSPNGAPQLTLDQDCNSLYAPATTNFVPSPPPAPLAEDMARFDMQYGHEIWANGVQVAFSPDTTPAMIAVGGAVGRAYADFSWGLDMRFDGDMAEILVYDTALDDASRSRVEDYFRTHWSLTF